MSIKTILTTIALVAGSSTAALARPVATAGHGPVVVRDHREPVRVQPTRVQPVRAQNRVEYRHDDDDRRIVRERFERPFYVAPAPVTYVQPAPVVYGQPTYATQGTQYIALGGEVGNGLEISLVQGEDQAFVDQVIVHYADGRDVPMHLDRTLNVYDTGMQLQTEACPINGITVIGSGAVSAYAV